MGFVFSFPKLYHLVNKNKPSREQQPLIHKQEQQYKTMFIKADMKSMIARILLFTIQRNLSRSNCFMDMLPSSLPSPLLFLPTSPCVCVSVCVCYFCSLNMMLSLRFYIQHLTACGQIRQPHVNIVSCRLDMIARIRSMMAR